MPQHVNGKAATMTDPTRTPTDDADDPLCGLAVYSSDLLPLGRISAVPRREGAPADTISGRPVRVEPIPTVRYILDGEEMLISESMIRSVQPAEDRVILNVPIRRVLQAPNQIRAWAVDVAE